MIDPSRVRPNRRVLGVAMNLEQTALLVAQALAHLSEEIAVCDGYPSSTLSDGMPPGSAELTSVERAVDGRQFATRSVDQIHDDIEALASLAASLRYVASHALGTRLRVDVALCDGREFEGSSIEWVPNSRDPDNGWHDPMCREAADASKLCPRCRLRERRWRDEHGIAQRSTNAAVEAETLDGAA